MKFTTLITFLISNFLFCQTVEGKFKLIAVDSTSNFYILKFASKRIIDSSDCFLITSGKTFVKPQNKLKINRKYLLIVKTDFPYNLGIEKITEWGVDEKTIWNKDDKCRVYSTDNISGMNYLKP